MVTRKRYVELTTVADDVIDYLKRAKVVPGEECIVQELCHKLWSLEFSPEAKKERLPITEMAEVKALPSDKRR